MSPDEWRALPWHEQRMYREGLAAEFFSQVKEQAMIADPDMEIEYVAPGAEGFGRGTPGTAGALSGLGLTVRKAGS